MKRWLLAIGARLNGSPIRANTFRILVLSLVACGLGYAAYHRSLPKPNSVEPSSNPNAYAGEPVPLNLTAGIGDGCRGEANPLLHGRTRLEVTASWVADGSRLNASEKFLINGHHFFLERAPARERQTYTERDFSAFLPEQLPAVGQIWSLDPDRVAAFLRQLHPSPSMHLDGEGRRVGPDGAFAILRGMTPSHLDIAFRVHAEFDVTADLPKDMHAKAWYAPAYFSGQMIVNRDKGTVEYFRLAVPTDKWLNVELTVKHLDITVQPGEKPVGHAMARIDRMELQGGNSALAARADDQGEAITQAEAQRRLQRVYYKFMDIQWLPFEDVLAAARDEQKPILAVVLWGNLDDQSC